jgi:IS30 family transposase
VPFAAQSFPIGSASVVGASKFEGGAEVGYTLERVLVASLGRPQTWDRGKELSAHAQFSIASGVKVYFADPKSPWQRGTNENTNGLLRQYFPKGTDLSRWSADEIAAIAHTLNT